MTDRELLELAAKAASYTLDEDLDRTDVRDNSGAPMRWNPLEDDGDVLRLAVSLDLHVEQNSSFNRSCCLWYGEGVLREELFEPWGDDKFAATRRAIVRAAAEIGRRMIHNG
jgi:hypothetical protein